LSIAPNSWIDIPFEVKEELATLLHSRESELTLLDDRTIDMMCLLFYLGYRRGVILERAGSEVVGEGLNLGQNDNKLGPGPEKLDF